MSDRTPASPAARVFTYRAVRALVLGVVAMVAVAWIVSIPAVCLAAVCGAAWALVSSQTARLSVLVVGSMVSALLGALLGAFFLGHGPATGRLLAVLVAALAAGPWAVVLGFLLRARAFDRR